MNGWMNDEMGKAAHSRVGRLLSLVIWMVCRGAAV